MSEEALLRQALRPFLNLKLPDHPGGGTHVWLYVGHPEHGDQSAPLRLADFQRLKDLKL